MNGRCDEGSAAVWTLGVAVVLAATVYATLLVCVAIGARHRVETAADLAALAGAAADRGAADGCSVAARVAAANAARLDACSVLTDGSVLVNVEVEVPPALASWGVSPPHASARAGR